jgi:hypothetical protein
MRATCLAHLILIGSVVPSINPALVRVVLSDTLSVPFGEQTDLHTGKKNTWRLYLT